MRFLLLLVMAIATSALSKSLSPPGLKLPIENFSLRLNTSISTAPWRPLEWRYRIQRDLYIVFTSYLDPVVPDDYGTILSSFREIIDSVNSQGVPADPMEFHKAIFGELVVDLIPYKDNPPPSRHTLVLVLDAVGAIMDARSPRLFRSRIEFGGLKRASFSIDWYQPAPHLAIDVNRQ